MCGFHISWYELISWRGQERLFSRIALVGSVHCQRLLPSSEALIVGHWLDEMIRNETNKACVFICFSWACSQGLTNLPGTLGKALVQCSQLKAGSRRGLILRPASIGYILISTDGQVREFSASRRKESCPAPSVAGIGSRISALATWDTGKCCSRFPPWHPPVVQGWLGQHGSVAVGWAPGVSATLLFTKPGARLYGETRNKYKLVSTLKQLSIC